uniref:uncharacterized protein LOC122581383 n=1 Tax=Erigeron canadensis TaxID=72917 RepID=UPI001CB91412|nr:uncharacterized protein LOC122581383 [Erigeron canadensis]
MNEETSLKFNNKLKKRAKLSLNENSGGFKKKGFRGKLSRGEITTVRRRKDNKNVDDGDERPNDNIGGYNKFRKTDNRGKGLKLKEREQGYGNERKGFEGTRKRVYGGKGLSREGGEERRGVRGDKKQGWEAVLKNRGFDGRGARDGGRGRRNDGGNGERRVFNGRMDGGNGEKRVFGRRESRDEGGDRQMTSRNGEKRTFDRRELRDGGGDRRKCIENNENKRGFLMKDSEEKYENSKQLGSPAEDREFGKKKFQNKLSVDDESLATFGRPKRKRRLFRIAYRNDPANKRFDDNLPQIESTTEKNEDSDTEEKAEMSQNAQFRAIQPGPLLTSFVNENLLGRRREIEFKKAGYNLELSSPLDNIPFSTSSERERIEESVFRNKLDFFAAAKVSSSFPPHDLPEIAFAGRSNVGKSSLLNSLTRQWGVVRTSDKPGLTQTINFFNLGSKLCLVDLPGYGFAFAKDEVKENWEELVKEYVSTREGLKRVCLLIDTKWGMKARDHELVDLMERSKTKYQIVLTKTDLSFPIDVARRAMQIEETLKTKKSAVQPLMMVSSKTGAGIRTLRTVLSNISRFARV